MDREVMAEMILRSFDEAARDARQSLLENARFVTGVGPKPDGKVVIERLAGALAAFALAALNNPRTAKQLLAEAQKKLEQKEN